MFIEKYKKQNPNPVGMTCLLASLKKCPVEKSAMYNFKYHQEIYQILLCICFAFSSTVLFLINLFFLSD